MKKLLMIFVLLFFTIKAFSQFVTMFNDTLMPLGLGGYGFSNIVADDSFYYASGGVNNYETNWQSMIVKLDKSGAVLKAKKYIDSNKYYADYPYNTMILNENRLLICPQVVDSISTNGYIIAIDKNTLDTLWTKKYLHPDTLAASQSGVHAFSDLTAIKALSDGGYILTGNYTKDCITGNIRSFLMKIDSVGNVQWRRVYNDLSHLYDIELTSDGGFVVIKKFYGPHIVKLDSLGNILWSKKINSDTINSAVSDLSYAGNNQFVGVTAYIKNGSISYPTYGLNVFKIDLTTQQIIWDKKHIDFYSVQTISLHRAAGIEVLANGDIIVNTTIADIFQKGMILKLTTQGDKLWSKTYNYGGYYGFDSQINDLIVADDGGFVGIGYCMPVNSNMTSWIFKTDANGVIGWESSVPINTNKIKVWPNPAKNFTNIKLIETLKQEAELIIYNSLGQIEKILILQKGQNEKVINLTGYTAGLYYFELRTNNKIIGAGKFIKE